MSNMQAQGQKLSFSQTISAPSYQKMMMDTLGDPKKKDRFVTAITSAVAANPALKECEPNSILSAGLLGETLNLSPSPQMGQYYLVPYKNKASFQIGYKGYYQLALRSGQYRHLHVTEVKEGELRGYNPFTEVIDFVAIEDPFYRETAETIGYYAYFDLKNGFHKSIFWSRGKVEAHRKQYSKGGSFWDKHFDAMAKKTVLRQLISKWGIISSELEQAITHDAEVPEHPTQAPVVYPEIKGNPPAQAMEVVQPLFIPEETDMTGAYIPPGPEGMVSLDDL